MLSGSVLFIPLVYHGLYVYQTVPSVLDVATRSPPAAWTTGRASDALSLRGSPATRSAPARDVWRTGTTRHYRPTVFSPFSTAAAEDEDMPGERVIFQRVFHLRGQTVEGATHIGDASDDPDSGTGWEYNHRTPLSFRGLAPEEAPESPGRKVLQHRLSDVIHSWVAHPRMVY